MICFVSGWRYKVTGKDKNFIIDFIEKNYKPEKFKNLKDFYSFFIKQKTGYTITYPHFVIVASEIIDNLPPNDEGINISAKICQEDFIELKNLAASYGCATADIIRDALHQYVFTRTKKFLYDAASLGAQLASRFKLPLNTHVIIYEVTPSGFIGLYEGELNFCRLKFKNYTVKKVEDRRKEKTFFIRLNSGRC